MNKNKSKQSLRAIYVEVRKGGVEQSFAVHSFKRANSPSEIFKNYPEIFDSDRVQEQIHGDAFPVDPSHFFSKRIPLVSYGILKEIVWSICRCAIHGERIASFQEERREFERALLLGDFDGCEQALRNIKESHGYSFWLIQNMLLLAEQVGGAEEVKKKESEIRELTDDEGMSRYFLSQMTLRTISKGESTKQRREVDRAIESAGLTELGSYLLTRLFDLGSPDRESLEYTLQLDAQVSVIDHYETLVVALRWLAARKSLLQSAAGETGRAISYLYKKTRDARLLPVLIAAGQDIKQLPIHERKEMLLATFLSGDHQKYMADGVAYLKDHPEDMIVLFLVAVASLRVGEKPELPSVLLGRLADSFEKCASLKEDAYAGLSELVALSVYMYTHGWALQARIIAFHCLGPEGVKIASIATRNILLMDSEVTSLCQLYAPQNAMASVRKVFDGRESSRSLNAAMEIILRRDMRNAATLGDDSRLMLSIKSSLANGDAESAIKYISEREALLGESTVRTLSQRAMAELVRGNPTDALSAAVDAYLRSEDVPTVIPVPQLVAAFEDPDSWPSTIDLPIVFGLNNRFDSGKNLPSLRYSFERFQLSNEIEKPSDFIPLVERIGLPRIVAYLQFVWIPEAMRQTTLYKSSREIEDARIQVCRFLAQYDPGNLAEYNSEIKERVKKQEIARGTSLVEQSKVYVDVPAIKKALRSRLSGAYVRYRALGLNGDSQPDPIVDRLSEALSELSATHQMDMSTLLSSFHILSDSGVGEADVQFDSLYAEITNEFVQGDHGLNSFLSTRVRHGRLTNAMRKAVMDLGLVSTKNTSGDDYIPNHLWASKLDELEGLQRDGLLLALQEFTRSFDSHTDYVKGSLIQVSVIADAIDSKSKADATFVYKSSNAERKFLRHQLKLLEDVDDFIDVCIDTLWGKTDINLLRLQAKLDGEVRARYSEIFEVLIQAVDAAPQSAGVLELRNAVMKASTSTQSKLTEVIGWFKRSAVYDREDYKPDLPVDIAINILKKTLPEDSSEIRVRTSLIEDRQLSGRTLDGMVDIFYDLLENAISHSGLGSSELRVSVDVKFESGIFTAVVTNNLASGKPSSVEAEKIERIRFAIGEADSKSKAQVEGGSGMHKIWRAMNSPFYSSPVLDFRFDGSTFVVSIQVKIEGVQDEVSSR